MAHRPRRIQTLVAHTGDVGCARLSRNPSELLVTGGQDCKVHLWRLYQAEALTTFSGNANAVECVDLTPSEDSIVAGLAGGSLKLWNVDSGKALRTLAGHGANCTVAEFHPFGPFLASGSLDGSLKVWDTRQRDCIQDFSGAHKRRVRRSRFSPDGRWVVSGGGDGVIKLWDLTAGKLMHSFKLHEAGVACLDFHPHEFLLASGSEDGTVNFWDLETFDLVGSAGTTASGVDVLGFAPEGVSLVSATKDDLKVWDWEPVRCCNKVTAEWGQLASCSVFGHEFFGCSLRGDEVDVWTVDLAAAPETGASHDKERRTPSPARQGRELASPATPCGQNSMESALQKLHLDGGTASPPREGVPGRRAPSAVRRPGTASDTESSARKKKGFEAATVASNHKAARRTSGANSPSPFLRAGHKHRGAAPQVGDGLPAGGRHGRSDSNPRAMRPTTSSSDGNSSRRRQQPAGAAAAEEEEEEEEDRRYSGRDFAASGGTRSGPRSRIGSTFNLDRPNYSDSDVRGGRRAGATAGARAATVRNWGRAGGGPSVGGQCAGGMFEYFFPLQNDPPIGDGTPPGGQATAGARIDYSGLGIYPLGSHGGYFPAEEQAAPRSTGPSGVEHGMRSPDYATGGGGHGRSAGWEDVQGGEERRPPSPAAWRPDQAPLPHEAAVPRGSLGTELAARRGEDGPGGPSPTTPPQEGSASGAGESSAPLLRAQMSSQAGDGGLPNSSMRRSGSSGGPSPGPGAADDIGRREGIVAARVGGYTEDWVHNHSGFQGLDPQGPSPPSPLPLLSNPLYLDPHPGAAHHAQDLRTPDHWDSINGGGPVRAGGFLEGSRPSRGGFQESAQPQGSGHQVDGEPSRREGGYETLPPASSPTVSDEFSLPISPDTVGSWRTPEMLPRGSARAVPLQSAGGGAAHSQADRWSPNGGAPLLHPDTNGSANEMWHGDVPNGGGGHGGAVRTWRTPSSPQVAVPTAAASRPPGSRSPLGLDFSTFAPVVAQGDTSSSGGNRPLSDADMIRLLMEEHATMGGILQSRLTSMQALNTFWGRDDLKGAIKAMEKMGDLWVWSDVLSALVHRPALFDLEACYLLLPLLQKLLSRGQHRQVEVALRVARLLLDGFGEKVRAIRGAPPPPGVDVQGEQRHERCRVIHKRFWALLPHLDDLVRADSDASPEAQKVMSDIQRL